MSLDKKIEKRIFKTNDFIDRMMESITVCGSKPGYFPHSPYMAGYIYGATDNLYQKKFPEVKMMTFAGDITLKYLKYYKEPQAYKIIRQLKELTSGSSEEFSKGLKEGGSDISDLLIFKDLSLAHLELYLIKGWDKLEYKFSKRFENQNYKRQDYKKLDKILKEIYKEYLKL